MNVLVTGGAGYIGSHTAKALARAGHRPVVYDNFSKGHRWAVRWGPLVEGELSDTGKLRDALRQYRIDAVIHFAALIEVGESVKEPDRYIENNFVGALSLLRAMTETGVKKFVFSSTAAVYGTPERVPIPETHPKAPINPYGDSKWFVERALGWYGDAYGIRSVPLRYFNACGADAAGEIGEDHNPESHLIPIVIQTALGQRERMRVFGTDYATPDGTAVRDYIHVADLASAHLAALDYLQRGGESVALNLGTGKGYSVRQIIEAVERISGKSVTRDEVERRAGDPPELVADASLARETLGWKPEHSTLEEIVSTALAWHAGGMEKARAYQPA